MLRSLPELGLCDTYEVQRYLSATYADGCSMAATVREMQEECEAVGNAQYSTCTALTRDRPLHPEQYGQFQCVQYGGVVRGDQWAICCWTAALVD